MDKPAGLSTFPQLRSYYYDVDPGGNQGLFTHLTGLIRRLVLAIDARDIELPSFRSTSILKTSSVKPRSPLGGSGESVESDERANGFVLSILLELFHLAKYYVDGQLALNVQPLAGGLAAGSLIVWPIAEGRSWAARVDAWLMCETQLPAPIAGR